MTAPFSPRLDILPPPQRCLWEELIDVPKEFVLYGGTAIALYLGYRKAAREVDLDHLPLLAGNEGRRTEPGENYDQ